MEDTCDEPLFSNINMVSCPTFQREKLAVGEGSIQLVTSLHLLILQINKITTFSLGKNVTYRYLLRIIFGI